MPNTIQIKRSSTPSAVPSSLNFGELALNYADGKLFYKNAAGNIVALSGSGSSSSSSASDLTSGTLSDSLLSDKAQAAINLYLWSTFR